MKQIRLIGRVASWMLVAFLAYSSAVVAILLLYFSDAAMWEQLRNPVGTLTLAHYGFFVMLVMPLPAFLVALLHRQRLGKRLVR